MYLHCMISPWVQGDEVGYDGQLRHCYERLRRHILMQSRKCCVRTNDLRKRWKGIDQTRDSVTEV